MASTKPKDHHFSADYSPLPEDAIQKISERSGIDFSEEQAEQILKASHWYIANLSMMNPMPRSSNVKVRLERIIKRTTSYRDFMSEIDDATRESISSELHVYPRMAGIYDVFAVLDGILSVAYAANLKNVFNKTTTYRNFLSETDDMTRRLILGKIKRQHDIADIGHVLRLLGDIITACEAAGMTLPKSPGGGKSPNWALIEYCLTLASIFEAATGKIATSFYSDAEESFYGDFFFFMVACMDEIDQPVPTEDPQNPKKKPLDAFGRAIQTILNNSRSAPKFLTAKIS